MGGFRFQPDDHATKNSPTAAKIFCLTRSPGCRCFAIHGKYYWKKKKLHLIEPHSGGLDRATVVQEPLPDAIEQFVAKHSPFLLAVGLLEVVDSERIQRLLQACFGVGVVCVPELARDEYVLARNTTVLDSLPDLVLVAFRCSYQYCDHVKCLLAVLVPYILFVSSA